MRIDKVKFATELARADVSVKELAIRTGVCFADELSLNPRRIAARFAMRAAQRIQRFFQR